MNTSEMTSKRRKELCREHGLSDAYIYQCLSGKKQMKSKEATRIERITGGEITRQMLRRDDYWLIWPDLPAPTKEASHA